MNKSEWIQVRIGKKEKTAAVKEAKRRGLSLSAWVRMKIKEWNESR